MLGLLMPITTSASSNAVWSYGYNKSTKNHFSQFYHPSSKHYSSITRNNVMYRGPIVGAGKWSNVYLKYTGPYKVTYGAHYAK